MLKQKSRTVDITSPEKYMNEKKKSIFKDFSIYKKGK